MHQWSCNNVPLVFTLSYALLAVAIVPSFGAYAPWLVSS